MSIQTPLPDVVDTVNEPSQPFGLPTGSVRGFMSLMICSFFWLVLLWPGDIQIKPLLGHFFLLALVLMAFASSPTPQGDNRTSPFLPWLLRMLFVGGSIAVVALCLFQFPERLQSRLTPDPEEFKNWWGPFLATMSIGFATGLFIRFVIGREHPVFRTFRSWVSVVGMVMLVLAREFLITGLRQLALIQGRVLSADRWGKNKTISQITTIITALVFLVARDWLEYFGIWERVIVRQWDIAWILTLILHVMMFCCVVLTILSGWRYCMQNKDVWLEL